MLKIKILENCLLGKKDEILLQKDVILHNPENSMYVMENQTTKDISTIPFTLLQRMIEEKLLSNSEQNIKKVYLTVIENEGKNYLLLAKDKNGSENYYIQAFQTLDDALSVWLEDVINKSRLSRSMHFIFLDPNIIEVPADDPAFVSRYFVDQKMFILQGTIYDYCLKQAVIEVNKNILELSACNVPEYIAEKYNMINYRVK